MDSDPGNTERGHVHLELFEITIVAGKHLTADCNIAAAHLSCTARCNSANALQVRI